MVTGTASSSVLLERKGMERRGGEAGCRGGQGSVRESLGYHQEDFGPLFAGQWFSFLIERQFLREFSEEIRMLSPI